MKIELSITNILIFCGIVAAISGNVFIVGKLFADFELLKTNIEDVQANQNDSFDLYILLCQTHFENGLEHKLFLASVSRNSRRRIS